jgi:hypothetical protein
MGQRGRPIAHEQNARRLQQRRRRRHHRRRHHCGRHRCYVRHQWRVRHRRCCRRCCRSYCVVGKGRRRHRRPSAPRRLSRGAAHRRWLQTVRACSQSMPRGLSGVACSAHRMSRMACSVQYIRACGRQWPIACSVRSQYYACVSSCAGVLSAATQGSSRQCGTFSQCSVHAREAVDIVGRERAGYPHTERERLWTSCVIRVGSARHSQSWCTLAVPPLAG